MILGQVAYYMFSLTCLGLFLNHNPKVAVETARLAVLLAALTQSSSIFVGESLWAGLRGVVCLLAPPSSLLPTGASSVSLVLSYPVVLMVPVAMSLLLWSFKLVFGHAQTTPTKED